MDALPLLLALLCGLYTRGVREQSAGEELNLTKHIIMNKSLITRWLYVTTLRGVLSITSA